MCAWATTFEQWVYAMCVAMVQCAVCVIVCDEKFLQNYG